MIEICYVCVSFKKGELFFVDYEVVMKKEIEYVVCC